MMWPLDLDTTCLVTEFLPDPENLFVFVCPEIPSVLGRIEKQKIGRDVIDRINYKLAFFPHVLNDIVSSGRVSRNFLLLGFRIACKRHLLKVATHYKNVLGICKLEALAYGGVALRHLLSSRIRTVKFMRMFDIQAGDIVVLRNNRIFERYFQKFSGTQDDIMKYLGKRHPPFPPPLDSNMELC